MYRWKRNGHRVTVRRLFFDLNDRNSFKEVVEVGVIFVGRIRRGCGGWLGRYDRTDGRGKISLSSNTGTDIGCRRRNAGRFQRFLNSCLEGTRLLADPILQIDL